MERYQTFARRIMAVIVDTAVFIPFVIFEIFFISEETPFGFALLWILVPSIIYFCYYIGLHWIYGQTLGKMVARVKVLDLRGSPISFTQSCLREVFYILFEAFHIAIGLYFLQIGLGPISEAESELSSYAIVIAAIWGILNVIVCLKSPKNRAVHDMIAGTVVVRVDVPSLNEAGKSSSHRDPNTMTSCEVIEDENFTNCSPYSCLLLQRLGSNQNAGAGGEGFLQVVPDRA